MVKQYSMRFLAPFHPACPRSALPHDPLPRSPGHALRSEEESTQLRRKQGDGVVSIVALIEMVKVRSPEAS
jgi:hypothetical protein